jgi:membrane carboxypeptidase/penicillin-binding protein
MLTFKVASFNIGYNCILRRPFLLMFMAVIHTAYATMKMPRPKGVITIKADQWDALACENTSLSHTGCFGDKAAQEQKAKTAKTQGSSTPRKTSVTKPPTSNTPRALAA